MLESRRAEAEKPTSVGPNCVCVLWRGQLCLRYPGSAGHKLANRGKSKMKRHILLLILRSRRLLGFPLTP